MSEDSNQSNQNNPWLQDDEALAVAAGTGLSIEVVAPAIAAYYHLLAAFGLVSGAWEAEGAELRRKYPDLLRVSVTSKQFISYELESVILQLETELPTPTIVRIVAAQTKLREGDDQAYLVWAKGWV